MYIYGACDRSTTTTSLASGWLRDRFTGGRLPLDARDTHDFAVLTIANELDVVRHGSCTPALSNDICALIESLEPYAPTATAVALADPLFN